MKFTIQLFTYLKSLWTVLAIAVAALPVMTYFSEVSIAPENSQISGLYGVLPSLLSAFALLLLTTFKRELKILGYARKMALVFVSIGFVSIFLFIGVKTFIVDLDLIEKVVSQDEQTETRVEKSRGIIRMKTFDLKSSGDAVVRESVKGDPWDIAGLASYTLAITGLSIGFCALGIHSFMNEKVEQYSGGNG